jgi:hypothetical protein
MPMLLVGPKGVLRELCTLPRGELFRTDHEVIR